MIEFRPLAVMISVPCVAAVMLGAPTAGAATDTTPPVWSPRPTTSFIVGSQLQNYWTLDDCPDVWISTSVSWNAADPESGINHYAYVEDEIGAYINLRMAKKMTVYSFADYNICGGGGAGRDIYAVNGADLSSTYYWHTDRLSVMQDNGESLYAEGFTPVFQSVTYQGAWSSSSFSEWSGGTTRKTTAANASATLTVQATDSGGGSYGVGVVMAKGPDRGKAAIYVDGVKKATVDTYSATKSHRVLVWRSSLTQARHTIKVVNLATPGHPRIDIDAFALLRK